MDGLSGVSLNLVESVDEASSLMRWLGERRPGPISIDTETTGLDHSRDTVRLFQVGDSQVGWALDWRMWAGVAHEVIKRYSGDVVMHNAVFDFLMLRKEGLTVPWSKIHDTRLMSFVVEPGMSTALKNVAARHVDGRAATMQKVLDDAMSDNGWSWATVPTDFTTYWQYGALDPVLTCRVYDVLAPRVGASEATRSSYELEVAAEGVVAGMMGRGTMVDVEYATQRRAEFVEFVTRGREWCSQRYGFSVGSNTDLASQLERMGVHLTERTAKGAWSMNREALGHYAAEYGGEVAELCDLVLRVRRMGKLSSTYLDHFINDSVNGVIRTSINTIGAGKTGRMTSSQPALHTLPRADDVDNPAAIAVRNCFIPRSGNKLIMCDFDQIEYRLAGHFAQDPALFEVFAESERSGIDPFTIAARMIYEDEALVKKDPRRQLTKNATYAKIYGAGAAKFSATARVPVAQGTAFLAQYDATFPGVLAFQRNVQRVAEQRARDEGQAWVVTPYGKRLNADEPYKLVNYLIQGTAADVFKRKLVELDMAGLGEYMILPVHDEVIFDVPAELVDDLKREAVRVMTDDSFAVPLAVGCDGPFDRWGDKYA